MVLLADELKDFVGSFHFTPLFGQSRPWLQLILLRSQQVGWAPESHKAIPAHTKANAEIRSAISFDNESISIWSGFLS